jgi:predicted nucleic acid-binding protein
LIVADTSAIVALVDADDRHHAALRALYEDDPGDWVLPWAIVPEVAYLLARHLGSAVEGAFMRDLAKGAWTIEWAAPDDLERACELCEQYPALRFGLVDALVMATAERLRSRAIATLDLRDFGAVRLRGTPRLYPRDLPA